MRRNYLLLSSLIAAVIWGAHGGERPARSEELLQIDNGTLKIGIDRKKGASITWLSWKGYQRNTINSHDPGRLIQQSYYAGSSINRQADGQHKAWSPWTWNPIQGGGVGSWARVVAFQKQENTTLFGETIPKLWDMPDEEAEAVMRQWTSFEELMPNVAVVKCEFVSRRKLDDRWGVSKSRHQELPACYFTRNFSRFESYLGEGEWRDESHPPGPPWGRAEPPRNTMACFNAEGQGIAVFSPASDDFWNFGPHAEGNSSDPGGGPCVHVAPLAKVEIEPQTTLCYRYWLVVGTKSEMEVCLDVLWKKYSGEKLNMSNP